MARTRLKKPLLNISPEAKKDIFGIIILLIAILSFLSMFNFAGSFGNTIKSFWQLIFGWGWFVWPFILIIIGYFVFNIKKYEFSTARWIGLFIFILSYSGILELFTTDKTFVSIKSGLGGGLIGYLIGMPLEKIASFWGAFVILTALFLISIPFIFQSSFAAIIYKLRLPQTGFLANLKNKFGKKSITNQEVGFEEESYFEEESKETNENVKTAITSLTSESETLKTKQTKKHYPQIDIPLELLSSNGSKPTSGDIKANQETIKKTLKHFGIEVDMGPVSVGPTVTQYTFKPASGIKLTKITTLINDLALALAAHPIRIEAPIPGKSLVGVEVPNQKIALVSLKEILLSENFKHRNSNLMMALGKDVAGTPWLADIDRMPHLMVAGSTGSGKTVCLNTVIVSLLYQNQPSELKLILVDPKQVEMVQYNNIPHLLCPVITDVKKTINALRWTVKEMENRFKTLALANKRNIKAYNESESKEKMPYLIIVIDELADLMTAAVADIEQAIIRLAQKARAVGIHLILATQKPSVDVITGLIKSNITTRIAFSVASLTDSRTILDHSGAEKLLGNGDMLYITSDLSKPVRIQGAYLSDHEIDKVVSYLCKKGEPDYNNAVTEKISLIGGGVVGYEGDFEEEDELLSEARAIVVKAGKASSSYLQRRLRIGYARAARLLDLLEDVGVVGPAEGSKPREVLLKSTADIEDHDQDLELNKLEQAHQKLTKNQNISSDEDYNETELLDEKKLEEEPKF